MKRILAFTNSKDATVDVVEKATLDVQIIRFDTDKISSMEYGTRANILFQFQITHSHQEATLFFVAGMRFCPGKSSDRSSL